MGKRSLALAIYVLFAAFALNGCAVDQPRRAITGSAIAGRVVADPIPAKLLRISVTHDGLVGMLFVPDDGRPHPGILRIGGSEGGLKTADAETLAENGYAVLALAYFGAAGLPDDLEEVPLEYFGKAITWMRANPRVKRGKLGIVGLSRGATVALLLPTIYDEFGAIIAMAPTHAVWQSSYLDWDRYAERSSHSYRGQALPFVPYDFSNAAAMTGCNTKAPACVQMYEHSLKQQSRVEAARIPVERINAPVLLISGKADNQWPSSAMGSVIMRRLGAVRYAHEFHQLDYDNAGHCGINYCFGGGTIEGNAQALSDGRKQIFAFLARHLGAEQARVGTTVIR